VTGRLPILAATSSCWRIQVSYQGIALATLQVPRNQCPFKGLGIEMKIGSKILGLLLIAALVAAPLATRAWAEPDHASAPPEAPIERPSTCHTHGGSPGPHSPLPASYKCCLTGHDAAVVQDSTSQQPAAQYTAVPAQIESLPTGYFLGGLQVPMVLSTDSPGTTPLRI
jgi:hypothetical protein